LSGGVASGLPLRDCSLLDEYYRAHYMGEILGLGLIFMIATIWKLLPTKGGDSELDCIDPRGLQWWTTRRCYNEELRS
jgi:hypothetical protein